MTVTYGFFNSLDGDRIYDAEQISNMFDGVIADGIFRSQGGGFAVLTNNNGMEVKVSSGRAWFNSTWTLNDVDYILTLDPANAVLHRIDTIVIEVDKTAGVRANSVKVITGTPSASPVRPTLINSGDVHQYPLADIYIAATTTLILSGHITNRIDIDTPYAAGITGTVQRFDTIACSATPAIDTDILDAFSITALAVDVTSFTTNNTGAPTNFQKLIIRIKDNGTARALAWGSKFEAKGVALPTTTTANKTMTIGFLYDTVTAKWGCVAVMLEV